MQRKRAGGLITPAEYARLRGLNRATISRQIKAGKIPTHSDGLIDPREADSAREKNLDPGKRLGAQARKRGGPAVAWGGSGKSETRIGTEGDAVPAGSTAQIAQPDAEEAGPSAGETPEADPNNYWKSRAAREYWESELSRLKAERERGSLIDAKDAELAWSGMIAATRSKILALPANLAHRLAVESDQILCEEMLKDAVHRLLTGLSEYRPGAK